jgi:catechol 2,3-dioxygenase-like lactoylglutathione lyase family enzyme|tara:strand:- start:223050 stop:223595 length:546 start_codon:yes stop_codon:yes gene_type:complete
MAHADPRKRTLDQVGYLVADIDEAVNRWHERVGLAPWTIYRNTVLDGIYRSRETRVEIDVALAYQGDVQVELIQLKGGGPNPYQDANGAPLKGIHHTAWLVDDLDAVIHEMSSRGLAPVFRANNAAVQVAYMEDPDEPNVLFELIEGKEMRAMIDAGIAETKAWSGGDPIREIDMNAAADS